MPITIAAFITAFTATELKTYLCIYFLQDYTNDLDILHSNQCYFCIILEFVLYYLFYIVIIVVIILLILFESCYMYSKYRYVNPQCLWYLMPVSHLCFCQVGHSEIHSVSSCAIVRPQT